ncbi:serine/threonine-protein kinase [Streptomyces sp. NPDC005648]|uniref:serine/threonine-protein kinase n=1 Tax=Streptomyces sp. NPDC005648 TaxID=3157044 RepID=UPI0033B585BD
MSGERLIAGTLLAERYRLLRQLESGATGAVWLAEDETSGRQVALRMVPVPTDDLSRPRREDFARWLRPVTFIDSPQVLRTYDVIPEGDWVWLATEYVPDTRSLAQVISEQGPLSQRETARVGLAVLRALRAAHAVGVVHRALAPERVLLAPDGRVLVTGFGYGELISRGTAPGDMLVGAPQYMAPETIQGGHAGEASDLFSLGAVLYTAVEGHGPFDTGTTLGDLYAVLHEEPPPPHRAGPLAPVLLELLRKDPARRPTAGEAEQRMSFAGIEWRGSPTEAAEAGVAPGWTGPALPEPRSVLPPTARAFGAGPVADFLAVTSAVLIGVACVVYVLPGIDTTWRLAVLWAILVTVAVLNARRRAPTYPVAPLRPPGPFRTTPCRGAAFLRGLTDAAVFRRPRTAVLLPPPTKDAYLREAYDRLGPPPSAPDAGLTGGDR